MNASFDNGSALWRRLPILLLFIAIIGASCGGSSSTAAPTTLEQTSPTESVTPEETPTVAADPSGTGGEAEGSTDLGPTTEDLAFVDVWVAIDGDRLVRAVPGETITIDYAVFNPRKIRKTFAIRANGPEGFDAPSASSSSERIEPRDFAPFSVEFVVPEVAEAGDTFQLEVFAAMTDDASRRAEMLTTIEVIDATGTRPVAGNDGATAPNSDQTTAFVIGNDLDEDNDVNWKSTTIVGGGFRALSVTAYENGTIIYVPFNDVAGNDVIIYEICDKQLRCDTALVNITIAEKVAEAETADVELDDE